MNKITNPILPGFHPDPSIVRTGDDYFIATSTFEWFPGVTIHHSRDLIHWRPVAGPLNRPSQLNMLGNPDSGGIFAPCLSYDKGKYYLVYTDVKTMNAPFKDCPNYLVTANSVEGDWSEPLFLNSAGFDPSLFHDEDGRKWLVQISYDHTGRSGYFPILLQEFDEERRQLVGSCHTIFHKGEGPHLYKKDGWYYLLVADGGTSYGHMSLLARSRSITGPYEEDPAGPFLTSLEDPSLELQKAGHSDLVETQDGEWYAVHLAARPLTPLGRCTLGRETAIQKVVWTEDGWLRLAHGGHHPAVEVEAPALKECPVPKAAERDHFDEPQLDIRFQTLRIPLGPEVMSLTERPGWLRLKGRESMSSRHYQSLVARRQQAHSFTASTSVEFEPTTYKQMAGLIYYYNTENYYYLRISHTEGTGKNLGVISCDNNSLRVPSLAEEVPVAPGKPSYLRATVNGDKLRFDYSENETDWILIGSECDASTISDEYAQGEAYTGAFIGMCCQDLSGARRHADFDFFEYVESKR